MDGLIGGWRLSGITSLQDGTRYNRFSPATTTTTA